VDGGAASDGTADVSTGTSLEIAAGY